MHYVPPAIQAIAENRQGLLSYLAKHSPKAHLITQPDVTIVHSNALNSFLNTVFSAHFSDDVVDSRVREVMHIFEQVGVPFTWELTEEKGTAILENCLQLHGMTLNQQFIGMYLELQSWSSSSARPKNLEFHIATSLAYLKNFSEMCVYFGEHDTFELTMRHLLHQDPKQCEIILGYAGKQLVVAGLLFLHAHTAGVHYIITAPEHRGKGYGRALTQHLLQRAKKHGADLAVLHSTDKGFPLYKSLGFSPCSILKEYVSS